MTEITTVSVIGLGYIGLPTSAIFAKQGMQVIGVDVNQQAVDTINNGDIHIVEPGLRDVVASAVKSGLLRATTQPRPADAFIMTVPTPFTEEKSADLSYIEAAAKSLAPALCAGNLIILESTSPVGTTEQLERWLQEARPDLTFPATHGDAADIQLAYCPERVLPGKVMEELVNNDRVIGGLSPKASKQAAELYKVFLKGDCLLTNARTAEMAKLTENSFRDVNIAFANELSLVCDELGINVWDLIRLANHHPRVNILQPGPGVGGHCIAVDPWFIVSSAPAQARLIRTAREVNDHKPNWVINKVKAKVASLDKPPAELTIACLGLAFKANIDDLRESPALSIAQQLADSHPGRTLVVEPNIKRLPEHFASAELSELTSALEQADVIVLLVDHEPFKAITRAQLDGKVWVDTKGLIDG
ncbi:UDP-N-acetyl-D-mannosamine dehydrogenase [Pseudidiomarina sp. 1APP75-27a]|uniref:UDP-N-acetyl-D-mannosamine dehydrogenase n=1 Tax=Pseudidiomarina terrestris TaxID=2820060 RepID=UPI002B055F5F|nr:UDP-N-acetyl-D-mannosamine dehydrogenase [Pseudidiomarina sp. 1APP75-27a]MEA3587703.1 UDP-N-acetyl-D-mannosamine dehydrogenase [Pseudidiomarina sp. 1APP75-27a]